MKSSRDGDIVIRGGDGLPARKKRGFSLDLAFAMGGTVVIAACVYGILTGAGIVLPVYSWACIGIIIGVINPMGRPGRS